jgi:type II secretory pathway component PulJ
MPKVSVKEFQRRIVDLDAQYTVAPPKRQGGFTVLRRVFALVILAIIAVAAFASANRTSFDFSRLTLKQGPAPAMLGATSTGFKTGE